MWMAMVVEHRRLALLLILAILLLSVIGLSVILLLIRAWRGHNQRQTPDKPSLPPTDIWHAAADRLKLPSSDEQDAGR